MKTNTNYLYPTVLGGVTLLIFQLSAMAQDVSSRWVQLYDYCHCGENEAQHVGLDKMRTCTLVVTVRRRPTIQTGRW